ncbi:DNA-binding protein [Staphylococcus arlettae]
MSQPLPKIGKPATHALKHEGITTLEQIAQYDKQTLLKLHGVGPNAIQILEEALTNHSLSFKSSAPKDPQLPFELIGDLQCDNAPKRRVLLDYIIATATLDQQRLDELLNTSFQWKVPGYFTIEGKDKFYEELSAHSSELSTIEVKHNITHGKTGAIHGTLVDKAGKTAYFADFIEFENHSKTAKIKTVTSYVIMPEGDL